MCSCWSALIAYCFLLLPFRPPLPHTSPCLVFDAVLYNQSFALITTLLRRTICSHLCGVGRDPADHLIFIGDTLPKSVYLSFIINAHHRRRPEAVVPQTPFLKRSKVRRWQDELIRVDENFGEIIIKSRQTEAMFCRGDVFNTLMNVGSCFSDWWYFFFLSVNVEDCDHDLHLLSLCSFSLRCDRTPHGSECRSCEQKGKIIFQKRIWK